MGQVHRATLSPTKQELVQDWLPGRVWAGAGAVERKLGEYRLDDPAGEVGVETILWQLADGTVVQTPLTYRAAPLAGAEEHLLGTSEHSVLGRRWVYDGCGDPVWATTLATAILTGGHQSEMYLVENGERVALPARMRVSGSGRPGTDVPAVAAIDSTVDTSVDASPTPPGGGWLTVVRVGPLELWLARVVGTPIARDNTLTGELAGSTSSLVLAGC